jgi:acetoin utilization deacetylase AcuC-like enzyme
VFKPDFVLISAGFDGHKDDPLASMQLTEEGYAYLTRLVVEIAKKHAKGRIISMLEGGYGRALGLSAVAHLKELSAQD